MNPTIAELHKLYASGEASPSEVCRAALDRIERDNGQLNAYITINRESALRQAAAMDADIQEVIRRKPLAGVPVAVKDNMLIAGVRTTCGSRILGNYVPPYTATAVKKLEEAGAIIIGKTNLDEFAMGSSTENSAFGAVRHPLDQEFVPGGSSGGSAVAVAAGHTPIALGSDTGGSIRQPASFCGVIGLKPTYGRVSRYGLVAFASSLDQIGPFANNVNDAARALQVISGHDRHDSTSANVAVPDYLSALDGDIKGLRVGAPPECFGAGLDPEVKENVEAAIRKLARRGAEIVEVSLPHMKYVIAVYYIIATAEASSNLARYDGVRYGFRAEAFKKCDVIATPTAPTPAFKIGEKSNDPLAMYLSDIYTVTVNLAGAPAISVPCGQSSAGLPIGLQWIGNQFDEARLLNAEYAYEMA